MKLFATADLHLGMKFSTFGDAGPDLSQARYGALERCVEAANKEKCELFIIAGDLFDRQNVASSDILKAAELLSGFAGSALLILPGNHDFFTGADGKPWGEFLRVMESSSVPVQLLSETRRYDLDHFDLPVSVFPGPCNKKHSSKDSISWIKDTPVKRDGSRLFLGLAHGSVEGYSPDTEGRYFPMTQAQLEQAPVDVWIVGHTHRPAPEEGTVTPRFFIPGTPEPDGFDCRHQGGSWILECSGGNVVTYTRIGTGGYRFYEIEAEIERAGEIGAALSVETPEKSLLSLYLKGALEKSEYDKLPAVFDDLRKRYFYLRTDVTNLDEVVNRQTVDDEFTAGSFPHRLLRALLEEGDVEAAQIAYRKLGETAN